MPRRRLNVVCIVADDLGWRDLGCYGSPFYETPHLDKLAQEGVRFTDAYASCPVCSPTRASVMSGKYPASVGVTNWIDSSGNSHPDQGKLVDAPYADHLPHGETSLAVALSDAGYATWHVGKWHLGGEGQDSLPEDHGFDVNVGGWEWGAPQNGYFSPWNIPTLDEGIEDERRYLPDHLGKKAAALIESHVDAQDDEPFFLNYCPYLVHNPIQAPTEAVGRYKSKREALGLDRFDEFEIDGRFPLERKKNRRIVRRLVQSNSTYAAMIEALDRNVGRVLEALARTDQENNTIVIFTSDNGGLATAEGSPTTNRPLREGKGWMAEGGNRVPFIIRWPGVTDADGVPDPIQTPITSPDIYPTILGATGVPISDKQDVEGEDLRPLLDEDSLNRDAIFWHYPHYGNQGGTPSSAIRAGNWKLIEYLENDRVELYDLNEDVREEHDLSSHCSEKVTELYEQLDQWRESVGARMPKANPDYEPWRERDGPG